jgi:hypothetical protein
MDTGCPAALALRALQKHDQVVVVTIGNRGEAERVLVGRRYLMEAMDALGAELGLECTGVHEGSGYYRHNDGTCPIHEWLVESDHELLERPDHPGRRPAVRMPFLPAWAHVVAISGRPACRSCGADEGAIASLDHYTASCAGTVTVGATGELEWEPGGFTKYGDCEQIGWFCLNCGETELAIRHPDAESPSPGESLVLALSALVATARPRAGSVRSERTIPAAPPGAESPNVP